MRGGARLPSESPALPLFTLAGLGLGGGEVGAAMSGQVGDHGPTSENTLPSPIPHRPPAPVQVSSSDADVRRVA